MQKRLRAIAAAILAHTGTLRSVGARRALPVALAAVLASPAVCAARVLPQATPLSLPDIAAWEHGAYRARDPETGETLWRTEWRVQRSTDNGRSVFHVEEVGDGRRDGKEQTFWRLTMTVELGGAGPRLASVQEVREAGGSPLWTERREFNYRDGRGSVIRTDRRTGATKAETLDLTLWSITPELLPATLRVLPGTADQQVGFELILGADVVGMRAEIVGREHVAVPAGSFECYKVRLRPTGLKGVFARLVLSDIFLWQTVAPPHYWVRYQGPEGGPGARAVVRELLSFDAADLPSLARKN